MTAATARQARAAGGLWAATACAAVAVPTLIAYHVDPSPTFFNQDAALIGWGIFLLVLAAALPPGTRPRSAASLALAAALAVLVAAALATSLWADAPWSLTLSAAGMVASALLVAVLGACAAQAGLAERAFRAFAIALLVAGIAGTAIGAIQVFLPTVPDRVWIATLAFPGRASGNIRQPNQLSTLLLWAIVAAIWLGEARVLRPRVALALAFVVLYGVVLTGSRTGAVGVVGLLLWGLLDKRLARRSRLALFAALPVYALLLGAMSLWAQWGHHAFGTQGRFAASGDLTTGRFGLWSQALSLIAQHPWQGVGVGQFNFAWTLTPMPGRYVDVLDHTHNLLLNLAVELGIPLALVVIGLMVFALWRALRNAQRADPAEPAPVQRAAFVIVALVVWHSMVEYPLWYAYFLLPAAFAFGLCLERPDATARAGGAATGRQTAGPFAYASIALVLAGVFAFYDYRKVAAISAASDRPIEQRIAAARRSVLFAHHADYAAAMAAARPAEVMDAFARASHFLLDPPFMIAWARALAERGDVDKARYVAERLREFHTPEAAPFFAPCGAATPASGAVGTVSLPFQCLEPAHPIRYEDFR